MEYVKIKRAEYDRQVIELYQAVGWESYWKNPQMLQKAMESSLGVFGAYLENRLVGLVRVVGDGCSIVYLQDLLVLPEYQGKGIGTKLVEFVCQEYQQVKQKILLTDSTAKNLAFYQRCGFKKVEEVGCTAFWWLGKS